MFIKQFGLQRSGTNAFRAIIEHNLKIAVGANVLGDKHGPISWYAMRTWLDTSDQAKELDPKLQKFLVSSLGVAP